MACNRGLAGLGVVAELADVFDNSAKRVFVFTDQLDVFLLLVQKDAGLILLAGKLAFEVGYAGGLSFKLVVGLLGGSLEVELTGDLGIRFLK